MLNDPPPLPLPQAPTDTLPPITTAPPLSPTAIPPPTPLTPSLHPTAADTYRHRAPDVRPTLVQRLGGSDQTEKAVNLALAWLARHQSADGRWSSAHFDDACGGRCGGTSKIRSDAALTGLALLCFLGADHTHLKPGPYQDTVGKGLGWLVANQSTSGDLRIGETMYSHGIATIALAEAYAMTRDERLRRPVETAATFIVRAAHPRTGGWRYDPGQEGDTSVLGWQALALISARRAGVAIPDGALDGAQRWLDSVSWPQRPGLYSYQPGLPFSVSMTAEGLFVRQLLGHGPDDPAAAGSVAFILEHLPDWERGPSTYYWYYATLALFQHQGEAWTIWNRTLTAALVSNQRTAGPAAGSWDPRDKYAMVGGRVYQTAICTLCLEVYYRYLPMYAAVPIAPAP